MIYAEGRFCRRARDRIRETQTSFYFSLWRCASLRSIVITKINNVD